MTSLAGLRVVDLSTGIAGAYASKLFRDAGADVVCVEPPGGNPLRQLGRVDGESSGALHRFLAAGKRSMVGAPHDAAVERLILGADLLIDSFPPADFDPDQWRGRRPGLVTLSITPRGRTGPWADRPSSEFTLQAESGSVGTRGVPGHEPFQCGGRITDYLGGTFGAVAALAAIRGARESGRGEAIDFSLLEVLTIAGTNYVDLTYRLLGISEFGQPAQSIETPSIEPTRDGYVGFCTNSRQQVSDFLLLIERPDLQEDERFQQIYGRVAHLAEWTEIVHAYTTQHTTAEIIERASQLRIPVAPVLNGDTVRTQEQIAARGVLRPEADGPCLQPRPPYRIDDADPPPPEKAPALGADLSLEWPSRDALPPADGAKAPGLPLAGIRVLDLTAWWAGPSSTHMLAALGADVIHVESPQRMDGMRTTGGMARHRFEDWWEASAMFAGANANKRGLALDMSRPRGLEIAWRLIGRCDAVIENFTPRVMDGWGLTWDAIHSACPQTILVRMPAFGLTGPWRDNTGFAQTMEQLTGLAWITGHPDDQPRIQRGLCDPLAGMHAAWGLLVALARRERTGHGHHVECTMVEGAMNAAARGVLEFSGYGRLHERLGNRSPDDAPQGLYATRDGSWLAIGVETEAHWTALARAMGRPDWLEDPELSGPAGRIRAHDRLDQVIAAFAAERDVQAAADVLVGAGVPATPVADPRQIATCPQHQARGFFEAVDHPVTGSNPIPGVPFRFGSVDRWIRSPAPTLGQHGPEILRDLLGLSDGAIAALDREGIIGTRPAV